MGPSGLNPEGISGGAGALPWLKDPFANDQEEPLREVMMVPLLEQLRREARGFALTAALAVALVRPFPRSMP